MPQEHSSLFGATHQISPERKEVLKKEAKNHSLYILLTGFFLLAASLICGLYATATTASQEKKPRKALLNDAAMLTIVGLFVIHAGNRRRNSPEEASSEEDHNAIKYSLRTFLKGMFFLTAGTAFDISSHAYEEHRLPLFTLHTLLSFSGLIFTYLAVKEESKRFYRQEVEPTTPTHLSPASRT